MRATSSGVKEKLKRSKFCSMCSGREVDVPVADLQGVSGGLVSQLALQLPGAEPEHRHGDAAAQVHYGNLGHASIVATVPGASGEEGATVQDGGAGGRLGWAEEAGLLREDGADRAGELAGHVGQQ